MPASLPPVAGEGPVCSQIAFLWYSLNPFFCGQSRLWVRLEPFARKFSLWLFFFFSPAIPKFGLLPHISSLKLSSGHSGLVLTLSMKPVPPCPAPAHWWWTRAYGLLLLWELWLGAFSLGYCFFFSSSYVALWDSKTPHRPASERVSCYLETSPPSPLPPQNGSLSITLLSLFLSSIFCSTSFWREWAAFLGV